MRITDVYAPRTSADSGFALLYPLAQWCEANESTLWLDSDLYPQPLLVIGLLAGMGHKPSFGLFHNPGEEENSTEIESAKASVESLTFQPVRVAARPVRPTLTEPILRTETPSTYWQTCTQRAGNGAVLDLRHLDFSLETYGFLSVLEHLGVAEEPALMGGHR